MIYLAYEKYKDSRDVTLGFVPSHWNLKKLKYQGRICNGKDQKEVIDDDGIYPILGTGGVFGKTNNYLHNKPSVLLGRKGTIDKPIFIDVPFWTVDTLYYTDIRTGTDPKFFFYCCKNISFDMHKYGSAVPSMTQEVLGNILLACPSIEEQLSIANFLDRETARIDALIEKKHKLIEALNEKRIAVISHAVTKGLNPHAPLKDSGIEWLGKVPEHWEVKKLKYVGRLKSGETITADSFEDEGEFPVYGGNGFRGFYNNYTHEGDYVIIGRQGALCGNINYANGKFWASEHAVVVSIIKDDEVLWLGELLRIMNLNQYSISAAQPGLAVDRISNLFIPVPPVDDQKVIVSYLKAEFKMINLINSKTQQAITKLEEYKTALISAAVTGKIKVPEITQANL